MSNSMKKTKMLAEAGVTLALSLALSYLKIPIGLSFGGFGGSIDLVMIPLILFSLRFGVGWGVLNGFAFGLMKYFLAGGFAISWASMFLDYSLAYSFVGLSGLFHHAVNPYVSSVSGCQDNPKNIARSGAFRTVVLPALAAMVGCFARFVIHYVSGVTIYLQYAPEVFLNRVMPSASVYSILYNGTYMLPNTVLAVLVTPLIWRFLRKK